jgi:hypothetical protein
MKENMEDAYQVQGIEEEVDIDDSKEEGEEDIEA